MGVGKHGLAVRALTEDSEGRLSLEAEGTQAPFRGQRGRGALAVTVLTPGLAGVTRAPANATISLINGSGIPDDQLRIRIHEHRAIQRFRGTGSPGIPAQIAKIKGRYMTACAPMVRLQLIQIARLIAARSRRYAE